MDNGLKGVKCNNVSDISKVENNTNLKDLKALSKKKTTSFLLGSIALFTVVLLWTFSSYLTSHVLDSYPQPFIITVASSLSFIIYFVFLIIPDPMIYLMRSQQVVMGKEEKETEKKESLPALTLSETARVAFVFFILYFLSNCLLNFSLRSGDLASVSNLASTSGFFTLLIGYFANVEILSTLRLAAVGLSIIATLLTVIPGFSLSSEATQAAFFALSSAFTYGVYSIYLKKVTKDESRVSMPILFAFVGLYTLLLVVPTLLVCHHFELYVIIIPTRDVLANIFINGIVGGLIPNYMWNVAFILTTPLMVAIGLSFSTPLGIAAGYVKDGIVKPEAIVAAFIIILSFVLLNLASLNEKLDDEIDTKILSIVTFSKKGNQK